MSSQTGFGQWYEEKKAQEEGGSQSGALSWMGLDGSSSEMMLPLFHIDPATLESFSWTNMKASMEAQMPKQILGMGYQQRFQVFCALLFLSCLFFALALFVGVPTIVARPQKFAISFTMGSLTFMASFGILTGPVEHLKSMLSADRLYFTFVYFGSMFMTLYFTFTIGGASGYLLVLSASGAQLLALLYYLISFLPGGAAGLHYVLAAVCQMLKPIFIACARFQAMCLAKIVALWLRGSSSSSEQ
ncbi:hypothetical protein ACA910_022111 [Epithemia clementina (nom. ined.)]